ncbi:hypothetical protein XENTR_v10007303 [Xenopus tropicalis]|nr:hypothetical protein XENTR_v10007303 [Xenopus tropicalis]
MIRSNSFIRKEKRKRKKEKKPETEIYRNGSLNSSLYVTVRSFPGNELANETGERNRNSHSSFNFTRRNHFSSCTNKKNKNKKENFNN